MSTAAARKPLRIEQAYPDLDRVWRLVESHGPYRSMAGLEGYREYRMLCDAVVPRALGAGRPRTGSRCR